MRHELSITDNTTFEAKVSESTITNPYSFSVIYYKYSSLIRKIVSKYEKDSDTVADTVHDIIIKIYQKLPSFQHSSKLSTWIYRIATNHCVDQIRKNKRRKVESLSNYEDVLHYLDTEFDEQEEKKTLVNLLCLNLEILSTDDKELLMKKYVYGLSIQEIMNETGLKSSAIKMRLKRSKDKLNARLVVYL